MTRGLTLTLLLSLGACAHTEERMEERYPCQTPRSEILAKFGEPAKHVVLSEGTEYRHVRAYSDQVRRGTGTAPASCDVYHVLRGASFGFGMYEDYVFYTKEDAVLQARRHFLD